MKMTKTWGDRRETPMVLNGEWWVGKKMYRWPRPVMFVVSSLLALLVALGGQAHDLSIRSSVMSHRDGAQFFLSDGTIIGVAPAGQDGCVQAFYCQTTHVRGPTGELVEEVHYLVDNYGAGNHSWSIPAGVFSVAFVVNGASAGHAGNSSIGAQGSHVGFCGGQVTGTLAVTPGDSMNIYVGSGGGGGGYIASANSATGGAGGASGHGAGGNGGNTNTSSNSSNMAGGGGGGASAVYKNGTVHFIAGGGGAGAGANGSGGGNGGGSSATAGAAGQSGAGGGGAGSDGSGGAAGAAGTGGQAGSSGGGSTGGAGANSSGTTHGRGGGGGGGGWGGGGGGGSRSNTSSSSAAGCGGGGDGYLSGSVSSQGFGTGGGAIGPISPGGGGGSSGSAGSISATYTVNAAPTQPGVFTEPDSGVQYNASISVAWGASTDAESEAITYSLYYSIGGGAQVLIASGIGTNSYTWNCSAAPASAAYRLHVYAVSGSPAQTSSQRQSDVFSIQHNVAPTPATAIAPVSSAVIDSASTNRFSWTFNDADVGDTISQHDIRYRLVGAGSWTTISTVVSTNNYHDFVGGTFAAGNYEWQVLTYDSTGTVATGWSSSAYFTVATAPAAPSITSPINLSTIGAANSLVVWSVPNQTDFQVRRLADLAGSPDTGTVYYDSGSTAGVATRDHALTFAVDGRVEHVQVRIKKDGLWSTWATVKVTIDYTAAAEPTIVVAPQDDDGYTLVTFTNPAPTGTEPNISENWLFRRVDGETDDDWVRIGTTILNNGTFEDYTAASGVTYEYRGQAQGDNDTATYSDVVEGTLTLRGTWIHVAGDAAATAYRFRYNNAGGEETWTPELVLSEFAGRVNSFAEFGEHEYEDAIAELSLEGRDEVDMWRWFAKEKTTVCYRDNSGRKVFGVIPTLHISSRFFGGTSPAQVVATDYDEAV